MKSDRPWIAKESDITKQSFEYKPTGNRNIRTPKETLSVETLENVKKSYEKIQEKRCGNRIKELYEVERNKS